MKMFPLSLLLLRKRFNLKMQSQLSVSWYKNHWSLMIRKLLCSISLWIKVNKISLKFSYKIRKLNIKEYPCYPKEYLRLLSKISLIRCNLKLTKENTLRKGLKTQRICFIQCDTKNNKFTKIIFQLNKLPRIIWVQLSPQYCLSRIFL